IEITRSARSSIPGSTRPGLRSERSIPTSFMAAITEACTAGAGSDPALQASCSGATCSKKARAIWLRPAFWRQRNRTVTVRSYAERPRLVEDRAPHGPGQLSRARVLLAGMIRSEQVAPFGERRRGAVLELRTRIEPWKAELLPRLQERVERDAAQRQTHAHARQGGDLANQVLAAAVQLLRRGLVVGRRASRGRGDVGASQNEAIVPMRRARRAGQALPIGPSVEPLPRAIPREHAPGSIGAGRPGRQPEDQEPRRGVAESRDGTAPVFLVEVRLALHARDLGAVPAQPRAAPAADHIPGDPA